MKTVRILSMDGGGIRGILPLMILKELESRIPGLPLARWFDMISGTSISGFIGCALASPNPLTASDMLKLVDTDRHRIFPYDAIRYVTSTIANSKYDADPLEGLLLGIFGDTRLSEATTKLIIPSYEIETRTPMFFKSWKALGVGIGPHEYPALFDFELRKVVRATSAAPTYYPPAEIHSIAGFRGAFIDGAIVANNPTMCALASAKKLYPEAERFVILSIGTGQQSDPIIYDEAKSYGLVNWARPLIDCLLDASADIVDYQIAEAFGPNVTQYRIQFPLTKANGAIDDTSEKNVEALKAIGRAEIKRQAALISALPGMLLT